MRTRKRINTSWLFQADRPLHQQDATQVQSALPAPPCQASSETSRAAANAVAPRCGTQAQQVLDLLRASPAGLTRDQICERTGLLIQAVCGRTAQLLQAGLIRATERTRPSRWGRESQILVAVPGEEPR